MTNGEVQIWLYPSWRRHCMDVSGKLHSEDALLRGNAPLHPPYSSDRRLSGPQSRSWRYGGERSLTVPRLKSPGRQAWHFDLSTFKYKFELNLKLKLIFSHQQIKLLYRHDSVSTVDSYLTKGSKVGASVKESKYRALCPVQQGSPVVRLKAPCDSRARARILKFHNNVHIVSWWLKCMRRFLLWTQFPEPRTSKWLSCVQTLQLVVRVYITVTCPR
jgi:hypothetical protein